jgi:hypothetical protein
MRQLVELVTNNSLVSALVAAGVLGALGGGWQWHRNRRDSEAIYQYLLKSSQETGYTFRSTEAIASGTHLPEERVAALCARAPHIRRNEKEKQSWTLS